MQTWIPLMRNLCRLVAISALFVMSLAISSVLVPSAASADPVDESSRYEQYASDRTPTGYSVGWGSLYYDESFDGTPLSLLVDGQERTFDHGFWAHADSSIYYNDIQEYGYERFDAWVGLSHTARANGKSAAVIFKVVADGQEIWKSDVMTERSDAVQVSLDISEYKVIQLITEATDKTAHPYNHAVWADVKFSKDQAAPWLSVSDKEFSNPEQVNDANILEGVFARTLSGPVGETDQPVSGEDGTLRNGTEGNDLTGDITYTTDYVEGETGSFTITYSVKDAQGLVRTRSVNMTVLSDEVYRSDADIDYLTAPFASFLYAGRDYFDEQGKAAFDLSVKTLLDFGKETDKYQLVTHWGEQVYKVTVDLQDAGIYMSSSDAGYLCSTIMDCEPRTFHVKDWGTEVSSEGGIASTVTFYVAKKYGAVDESGQSYYHTRLLQTEVNASRFLANIEEGMSDSQRLRAVLMPYADWIVYGSGGQVMDEALAGGIAVCGGNARGSIYLSQRMGIKSYWVRTDSHAWSNVKLNRDDSGISTQTGEYYRIDLLAGTSCFISIDAEHEGFHGHHKAIYFNRMKGYPNMVSESYPYAWTGWPSVTISVEDSWVVLTPDDAGAFDPTDLIESANSIYDGNIKESVSIDLDGLEENDEGLFEPGYYELTYTARDTKGNSATGTVNVQVVGGEVIKANAENCETNIGSTFLPDAKNNLPSLWNGSGEVVYSYGIQQNDGGKSVTYKVDRQDGTRLTYLDAWVGLHRSTRDSEYGVYGKVRFQVTATVPSDDGGTEERVLYTSPDMTRYTVQEHVLVKIPDDATMVTLSSDSLGSGNGHARWGNPRFFTSDILDTVPVAPTISNVENGATYKDAVTPIIEGASEVFLYRKNLPALIDPDSGSAVADSGEGDVSAASDSTDVTVQAVSGRSTLAQDDWGSEVEGYQPGDTISEEGVYTLVAQNEYRQQIVLFTIKRDLERIAVPNALGNLSYTGEALIGVPAGEGYTLSNPSSGASIDADGNATAIEAGSYTVTATPKSGYAWLGGDTSAISISFSVSAASGDESGDGNGADGDGSDDANGDNGTGDNDGDGNGGVDGAGDGAGTGDDVGTGDGAGSSGNDEDIDDSSASGADDDRDHEKDPGSNELDGDDISPEEEASLIPETKDDGFVRVIVLAAIALLSSIGVSAALFKRRSASRGR